MNQSGCYANPGWGDDAIEFRDMRTAMDAVGMDERAQREAPGGARRR